MRPAVAAPDVPFVNSRRYVTARTGAVRLSRQYWPGGVMFHLRPFRGGSRDAIPKVTTKTRPADRICQLRIIGNAFNFGVSRLRTASLPESEVRKYTAARMVANFGFKRDTRIKALLVWFWLRSSPSIPPQVSANF